MEIYLDNAATTKPHAQVISAMVSSMNHGYFNPSALYRKGFEVEKELNKVREAVLTNLMATQHEVIFTSGGTEANNLAILGHLQTVKNKGTVFYSAIEHAAVIQSCKEAERLGFTTQAIPVTAQGLLDMEALEKALDEDVVLICVMQVNNEVGTVQPIGEVVSLRNHKAPKAAIHVDGVQGFLRIPTNLDGLGIQSYVLSGHKIHGPKGIGALVKQKNHRIGPLAYGGGQEKNVRSGTENTVGVIGLGEAIEVFIKEDMSKLKGNKNRFWQLVKESIPQAIRLGAEEGSPWESPHIVNISFPPIMAETLLHALEAQGVYVSTGSACSSKKQKIAHTLVAMGVENTIGQSALRISISPFTQGEELKQAGDIMATAYRLLSPYKKR